MKLRFGYAIILAGLLATAAHAGPFHHTVMLGDLKAVRDMVKADPHLVNARDEKGHTPLSIAVVNEHPDIVQFLVSQGADVNAREPGSGRTPLEQAAINDNLEITKTLLAHGANVHLKDNSGRTALWWASRDTMPPAPQICALLRKQAARK